MNNFKVGIIGGTFDPIHYGHIAIAQNALIQYELDKIIFIPSGISYFKKDRSVTESFKRLQMVKNALKGYSEFEVSDIEVIRGGDSYTYETLEVLQKEHPEYDLYFILGEDSLLAIDTWKYPERIFEASKIICACRNDKADFDQLYSKKSELEKIGACVYFLNMEPVNISSTLIRTMVRNRKDISNLVPESVKNFIFEEHLYEEN